MAKLSKIKRTSARQGLRGACPSCRASFSVLLIGNIFLDKDGNKVRVRSRPQLKRATYQECPKCHERWPVFARDEDEPQRRVVETTRTEEWIGDESRRIENNTSASVQRRILISREWTRQIQVGLTEESRTSVESKTASKVVGLTVQMQKSIQKHYDVTVGEIQRFDEEVLITIPMDTSIEVILSWKRIWQNGYLEPGMGYGVTPFRICVGLTFDLQQRPLLGDR